MFTAVQLVPFFSAMILVLVWLEIDNQREHIYYIKPTTTLVVIAMALLSFFTPSFRMTYSVGILVGLLFSLGGDIVLMFQEQRRAFMIGLVLFLLAHVVYTVVFFQFGRFSFLDYLVAAVLLLAGFGFYRLIQPNLGQMKVPVIVYIIVISVMVSRAISTYANPAISDQQARMIALGAVLFFISDIILAANRFWKPWKYNRVSLVFYYSGQALIALAASYFV